MEVVELKITNPNDREAVAKQVAAAVVNLMAGAEKKQAATDEELKTDADDLDTEELEAATMTEEFKAFNKELGEKIEDLNNFIEANRKSWNCSAVVAVTAIKGKNTEGGGVTFVGRGDAVCSAIDMILGNEDLSNMVEHLQKKREALAYLAAVAAKKSEESDGQKADGNETDKSEN